ncbi:putative fimbrial chaperone YraI [Providencia alcalifaciens]|uniref:fimbrial biogenesis chaperone n=1 Tax=Providencia alcalifaciens TaxID=126385 RepID=UPI000451133F|nr:molecular chaperone [Providencia alcalifaciens]EUD02579.1 PapD pilus/flagellar-assembly chaperone N-terminal domain protein [Providencia alcalifaciens RIMD 1656011]CAG9421155.1 putative fimbrial chaperone YraI [Providencia alcalifaciens]
MKKLADFTYLILLCLSFSAYSVGLRLEPTRLILNSDHPSTTFTVINGDSIPYFIQATVTEQIEGTKSPYFLVTPYLFRLEANSQSSARVLLKNNSELPADRESLFFLNTRAIPAEKHLRERANKTKLTFVTNIIIKVFYRPSHLSAPNSHIFQRVTLHQQQKMWKFNNPTPYYLTVVNIKYNQKNYNKSLILAPFSDTEIPNIQGNISLAQWQMINDFGGLSDEFTYLPAIVTE